MDKNQEPRVLPFPASCFGCGLDFQVVYLLQTDLEGLHLLRGGPAGLVSNGAGGQYKATWTGLDS